MEAGDNAADPVRWKSACRQLPVSAGQCEPCSARGTPNRAGNSTIFGKTGRPKVPALSREAGPIGIMLVKERRTGWERAREKWHRREAPNLGFRPGPTSERRSAFLILHVHHGPRNSVFTGTYRDLLRVSR
jgi:hypothetical protein